MIRRTLLLSCLALGLPDAAAASDCLIAIDPGHTRTSPGATSARGRDEWLFNVDIAAKLAQALERNGLKSLVINAAGNPIGLRDRPLAAEAAGAALLLSIHHDSAQQRYLSGWEWQGRHYFYSDQFSGYGLFVSGKGRAFDESRHVAELIADGLLAGGLHPSLHHAEAIPGENRPLLDARRGIYQYDELVVLKYATMPAVLVEVGVIVNRDEENLVSSPAYQERVVAALASAAAQFCAGIGSGPRKP